MKTTDLVSIIVPIYQVEKYLSHCIESLLAQTYRNIEIILVDDGSPDNCGKICDFYAAKDARIHVIHRPNGGVSRARNQGIAESKGEFLAFVDGDDLSSPFYIECMVRALKETGADIATCGSKEIFVSELTAVSAALKKNETEQYQFSESELNVYDTKGALERLFYQIPIDAAPWSKLFRREVFDGIEFPSDCWYEDISIMPQLFERAKKVVYDPFPGYLYVLNPEGTTLKTFSAKKMELISILLANEKRLIEHFPELAPAAYSRTVRGSFHIYLQIPGGREFREFRKEIEKNIKARRMTVLRDSKARRGTKISLIISWFSFALLRKLKNLRYLGKK